MEMDNRGVEFLERLYFVEELEMCMNQQLDELVFLFWCCYMGLEKLG